MIVFVLFLASETVSGIEIYIVTHSSEMGQSFDLDNPEILYRLRSSQTNTKGTLHIKTNLKNTVNYKDGISSCRAVSILHTLNMYEQNTQNHIHTNWNLYDLSSFCLQSYVLFSYLNV